MKTGWLDGLRRELAPETVFQGSQVSARYASDWTRRNPCLPQVVFKPHSTEEVSVILRHCHAAGQPVVVQGGLTGLAGGATPRAGEVALSTERLVGIDALDPSAGTLIARSGTPLAVVQAAATEQGLSFPLDLGARGSCSIGGNLSTNAGGNRVIRYGMARDLVLGLEAVLADGTIVSSMNSMMKNNAGFDLKQLFLGTEGTLGVVTRAVLRLHPAPREQLTAFVALPSFDALVALLRTTRAALGGQLGSFETLWSDFYEYSFSAIGHTSRPFTERYPLYALVEMEAFEPVADRHRFEALLADVLERGIASDAVLAGSLEESARLWRVRDAAGELAPTLKNSVSYDIGLPIPRMADYLAAVQPVFERDVGPHPAWVFGHLGDGNLHVIAGLRDGVDPADFDAALYAPLAGIGSVSAEHGIGVLKRSWLGLSRNPEEIALMRRLKEALDPRGILNPGRVI